MMRRGEFIAVLAGAAAGCRVLAIANAVLE
jgi:hypothetical protein